MLEDQWGGATTTLDAMLVAAATPFVLNNQLSGVRLRRSSNENSRVPSILTVAVGRGKTAEIRVSVEYESHGMAPRSGARYYSNDGNFVCMEAEPAGQKTPLAYLEGKDSASNPTGTPNGNNDKFTLKEYLLSRAVSAAPVNLLWRPAYNLYPVQSVGPAKVGERLKAKYNMSVPSSGRTDTPTGMFNEVEAACLARFLS